VSGPLHSRDVTSNSDTARATEAALEITDSRLTEVGRVPVRWALPQRTRRSVGAWCFADHAGPVTFADGAGPDIGPHPHMGLQTVTWLVSGELVHRDSLGTEQPIRPGQLNLMTAGEGVSHAEEAALSSRGDFHGIQLWVAQPESTRHDAPAFEHHAELPRADLRGGTATVLIGTFASVSSPARRDSDHLGVELELRGPSAVLPLEAAHEHALIVLSGALVLDGRPLEAGYLAYLGTGRDEYSLETREPTRAILLGGVPFDEPLLMWWNFVARERDEMLDAYRHWDSDDGFFGRVDSRLGRVAVGPPPWLATP